MDVAEESVRERLMDELVHRRKVFLNMVAGVPLDSIADLALKVRQVVRSGRSIYLIGNGGSAAVASHLACDLRSAIAVWHTPVSVWCLNDSVATMTAIANDLSFDETFVHQLQGVIRAGDLVIALSVSGCSENVIRATEYARSSEAAAAAMTCSPRSPLAGSVDHCVLTGSEGDYGQVEDLFSFTCHALAAALGDEQGHPRAIGPTSIPEDRRVEMIDDPSTPHQPGGRPSAAARSSHVR